MKTLTAYLIGCIVLTTLASCDNESGKGKDSTAEELWADSVAGDTVESGDAPDTVDTAPGSGAGSETEDICQPNCDGKECGSDGCGGSCGECDATELLVCLPEVGKCAKFDPPQCEGKECGDDGMGGSCGTCEEGFVCVNGNCDSNGGCQPNCDGKECGSDGCAGSCGECDAAELLVCVPEVGKCAKFDPPQCEGKECGDDGMGGSCGTCEEGACVDGMCEF